MPLSKHVQLERSCPIEFILEMNQIVKEERIKQRPGRYSDVLKIRKLTKMCLKLKDLEQQKTLINQAVRTNCQVKYICRKMCNCW